MTLPHVIFPFQKESALSIGHLYPLQPASAETDSFLGSSTAANVVRFVVVDWKTTGDGAEELVTTSTEVSATEQRERPTESLFRKLALSAPSRLLALIASNELAPPQLTFAAEIAGSIPEPDLVVPVLSQLLAHDSALVREGAVLGLAGHIERAIDLLRHVAESDPSEGVQDAARDVLASA